MVNRSLEELFDASEPGAPDDSSDEFMDALFEAAFKGYESCQEKMKKIASRRVAVSTPTHDAKNEVRVLVTQGEGSSEVRVHRGQTHQVYPCTPMPYAMSEPSPTLINTLLLSLPNNLEAILNLSYVETLQRPSHGGNLDMVESVSMELLKKAHLNRMPPSENA